MADCFITRRGGGSSGGLNFEVVGGTTQPTNPKENTIWVNTDTPIAGWALSVDAPENPAEGMVHVTVGSFSLIGFNALKRNSIEILPVSVSQYINWQWTTMEAMIFQDGMWKEWAAGRIYYLGEEYIDFTGGISIASNSGYSTATKNTDNITIGVTVQTNYADRVAVCYATNKLNLAGYKTLYAKVTSSLNRLGEQDGGLKLFVANGLSEFTTLNRTTFNALEGTKVQDTGLLTLSLDISSRNENMYVGVSSKNRNAVITEIWME